jgi:hypothetical protein
MTTELIEGHFPDCHSRAQKRASWCSGRWTRHYRQ